MSTVDKEVRMGGLTSYSSTLMDDCSKSTYVDEGVSDGSLGSEVNDDVQVRQTSVEAKGTVR